MSLLQYLSEGTTHLDERKSIAKALYASIFLLLAGDLFGRVTDRYLDHLGQLKIGQWTLLVGYEGVAKCLFLLIELTLILVLFGSVKGGRSSLKSCFRKVPTREIILAILAAIATTLISLPFLLKLNAYSGFVSLLTSRFFSLQSFLLLILIVVMLPIATELVYRAVIFRGLADGTTATSAVIVSSFVFASTWPVYTPAVGTALGVTTALLFKRSQSLVPSLVANVLVSLLCLVILMLYSLK